MPLWIGETDWERLMNEWLVLLISILSSVGVALVALASAWLFDGRA